MQVEKMYLSVGSIIKVTCGSVVAWKGGFWVYRTLRIELSFVKSHSQLQIQCLLRIFFGRLPPLVASYERR